jgi:hypothetical protein
MKARLIRLVVHVLVALLFTALTMLHLETRDTFHWGHEWLVCTLMSLGISVNLYIKSSDKRYRPHVIKAVLGILLLWSCYLLFEEFLLYYSFLQFSVAYQFISPFLVLGVYFLLLKFIYRLKRVVLALIVTETILAADLITSFFAETMGELYYPASLLFVILFAYPAIVRFKENARGADD